MAYRCFYLSSPPRRRRIPLARTRVIYCMYCILYIPYLYYIYVYTLTVPIPYIYRMY